MNFSCNVSNEVIFTTVYHCIYRSCGRVARELECSAEGRGFEPRSDWLKNAHCPPSREWVPDSFQGRCKVAKGENVALLLKCCPPRHDGLLTIMIYMKPSPHPWCAIYYAGANELYLLMFFFYDFVKMQIVLPLYTAISFQILLCLVTYVTQL